MQARECVSEVTELVVNDKPSSEEQLCSNYKSSRRHWSDLRRTEAYIPRPDEAKPLWRWNIISELAETWSLTPIIASWRVTNRIIKNLNPAECGSASFAGHWLTNRLRYGCWSKRPPNSNAWVLIWIYESWWRTEQWGVLSYKNLRPANTTYSINPLVQCKQKQPKNVCGHETRSLVFHFMCI